MRVVLDFVLGGVNGDFHMVGRSGIESVRVPFLDGILVLDDLGGAIFRTFGARLLLATSLRD